MILPIGHQEREVRRLPWVTFALIAACVLAFLFTDTSAPPGPTAEERFETAADYWRQRAYLKADPKIRDAVAYDVAPAQRNQYLATLPDLSPYGPEVDGGLAAQQAELDRLTDLALGVTAPDPGAQTAFERYGLVPSALHARSFITHMFVHAGWFHLIGNLFMLLLAGPPIEDRWGRAMFAAFYAISGVFAAAFYAGLTSDPAIPMVGASGAIAGVLGAFMVRLWSTQIRFAYFFVFGLRPVWGTFEAPAWAMLSLWFANELFQAWFWGAAGLAGGGVAYWAHVGGFAFGAGAAYAIRASGIEQRFIDPAIDAKVTRFSANPVLEDAMVVRERGDAAGALAMLRAEWDRAPDDGIGLALWDAAVACGEAASAAPALLAVVRAAAQRGEHELALRHWSELSDHAPDALADPATLLRFAPLLLAENQRERAALALRQSVDPNNSATPSQALRVFELARELDPATAARAARRALQSPDLHDAKRAKLQSWVDEHGAAEPPPPVPTASAAPAEVAAPIECVFGDDGVVELARFARTKLTAARPTRLDDEGIYLSLEADRSARVAWSRIQAVSVAIVARLANKPILLIDLLANWNTSEAEELVGVRLRSDTFDPRALLGIDGDPRRAFATLAGRILQATRAQPLPSAEQALGNPFARFESPADYERIVLEVSE